VKDESVDREPEIEDDEMISLFTKTALSKAI
jgi:hypothetical protein